ncbi:glycosyltransferase family 2 protein [Flavihumibacter cheonanensis]|uniref:glycosyltransferase family 2 protein n=1 Tax=Flavihumibacter cheonanensis TaxID=1442385 RepID=UPI001EF9A4A3|nr:glycosyltransferase family 2 protein [Flavihumibacter cheonanensis]MCG7754384.1 glycosyltransferase family 2 protein [Flavihumibacter cheonanensis]
MEVFFQILFWVSLLLLLYIYIVYGLLVYILAQRKPGSAPGKLTDRELPSLTVLIPAFNEAAVIGGKIRNTLSLRYPREKFRVLIITDGSTDGTEQIVRAFPQVDLLHEAVRLGKAAAINRAMQDITSDLVVLTDANTVLNEEALLQLVQSFDNPAIGAVSGEKLVVSSGAEELSSEGEGLYWKYESFLKQNDARLHSIVGAAGELLALRTNLFTPLEPDTVLDDFILSMRICEAGYRVAYQPDARAVEAGSFNLAEEQKRKIRIAAGGFQALGRLSKSWEYRNNPLLFFQFFSHRVLRWVAAAPALILLALSTIYLVVKGAGGVYELAGLVQLLFYGLAVIGWLGARTNTKWPIVYIPYYFVFMHWAILAGLIKYLTGGTDARWEKANRIRVPVNPESGDASGE